MANAKESFKIIYASNGQNESDALGAVLLQVMYLAQLQESKYRGDKHILAALVASWGDKMGCLSNQYRGSRENGVHKN